MWFYEIIRCATAVNPIVLKTQEVLTLPNLLHGVIPWTCDSSMVWIRLPQLESWYA